MVGHPQRWEKFFLDKSVVKTDDKTATKMGVQKK